jgi:uncharacterized protein (DUF1697 family)
MLIYVAMLRGINVSGQKIVKMENLRSSFEELGFQRVRTYVQSGNVIFEATRGSAKDFAKSIQGKILSDFGFSIPLFLRTSDEMKKIVSDNPFSRDKEIDRSKLHVTFLSEFPANDAKERLSSLNAFPDQFRLLGREVYLYCPNGYGRTKLSNNALEKQLSIGATTRNWKTVNALTKISLE